MSLNKKKTVLVGLIVIAVLPISFRQIADVDGWWHLQIGRSAVTELQLPSWSDYYSTPVNAAYDDLRYTVLGDIVLFLVHRAGGDIGLQLFRLMMVGLTLWMLSRLAPKRTPVAILLLILILVTVATYQLQLMRNAIFSMPLTMWAWLVLARDHRNLQTCRWWSLPAIIFLWSFMHGSYLLGIGLVGLVTLGESVDALGAAEFSRSFVKSRGLRLGLSIFSGSVGSQASIDAGSRLLEPIMNHWILVAAFVLLVAVSAAWAVVRFRDRQGKMQRRLYLVSVAALWLGFVAVSIRQVWIFTQPRDETIRLDLADVESIASLQSPSIWVAVKRALNHVYWKIENAPMVSSDFLSPFEFMDRAYIWVALALLLVGVIVLWRNRKATYWIPFIALAVLGLGYARLTGYMALVSGIMVLTLPPEFVRGRISNWAGFALSGLAVMMLYLGPVWRVLPWNLSESHVVDFGRHATFSDEIMQSEQITQPFFNTIANGGFLLYRLSPRGTRVFVDGFFLPHSKETLPTYRWVIENGDLNVLQRLTNFETALVASTDRRWLDDFFGHPDWRPVAMDFGQIAFRRDARFDPADDAVEFYFDEHRLKALDPVYRALVCDRLFEVLTSLTLSGHFQVVDVTLNGEQSLLRAAREWAHADAVQQFDSQRRRMLEEYGPSRGAMANLRFGLQHAIERGEPSAIIRCATRLIQSGAGPDVLLQRARAHLSQGNANAALRDAAKIADEVAESPRIRRQCQQLLFQLANVFEQRKALRLTFESLRLAFDIDPQTYPRTQFLNEILQCYRRTKDGAPPAAVESLLRMTCVEFPDSAHAWHNLAFELGQRASGRDPVLVEARQAGMRALELMREQGDQGLDIVYDNLARIAFRQDDLDAMKEFEDKAIELAPPERKRMYRSSRVGELDP